MEQFGGSKAMQPSLRLDYYVLLKDPNPSRCLHRPLPSPPSVVYSWHHVLDPNLSNCPGKVKL